MVCIVKRRAILVLPLARPGHLEKLCFPRCLAFAKLDTRKKEALTSKLAAPLYYSCPAWTQCSSMFSINIPYPLVGSLTKTWVTAPTNFPS